MNKCRTNNTSASWGCAEKTNLMTPEEEARRSEAMAILARNGAEANSLTCEEKPVAQI